MDAMSKKITQALVAAGAIAGIPVAAETFCEAMRLVETDTVPDIEIPAEFLKDDTLEDLARTARADRFLREYEEVLTVCREVGLVEGVKPTQAQIKAVFDRL